MNIEWIKCSDLMPPDDDSEIFIRRVVDGSSMHKLKGDLILTPANEIWYDVDKNKLDHWEWTEFAQEKWEFLNK